MHNIQDIYQAELDYRREQVRLDRRSGRARRRSLLTRNRVRKTGSGSAA